jgi:curved DNA-binding protein CbpA
MLQLPPPKRPGKGNAFDVLGVSPDASLDEVEQVYRYFAHMYHPDVNPNYYDDYVRVNEAYAELTKRGEYARLKLRCDVVETKAKHAESLRLIRQTLALTGIEIPPLSMGDFTRCDDADQGFKFGSALLFRCPVCKWKEECDRATGFGEVESFHREFMRKAMCAKA